MDTPDGPKAIETLQQGDRVLSHDGSFAVVEDLIENPPNEQALIRISHFGHKEPILCTPEHPILVWTTREVSTLIDGDGADPFNGFVWLAAKDIQPADFIVTAAPPLEGRTRRIHDLMDYVGSGEYEEVDGLIRKVNTDLKHRNKQRHHTKFVSVNRYVEESYDLGLVLGWYVAEGHISKRSGPDSANAPNGIHFTVCAHELEYQQELAAAFKRVFAADLSVHQSVSDQSVRMVCNSKVVASLFLSMVGTGYHLKRLSHEVLTADEEFQRGLLAGLFRGGDGCSTTGGMVLDLVNPQLIDQVQLLLRRVGIVSRVRQYVNQAGNVTGGQVFVPGLPGHNEDFIFDVGKNLHNYVGGQKGASRKNLSGGAWSARVRRPRPHADAGNARQGLQPPRRGHTYIHDSRHGRAQLLPVAHRGQHGVHRSLHQLGTAAVQAWRRSCLAAVQHSRARCPRSRTSRTRARASSRS